jgi:hypothetical protein
LRTSEAGKQKRGIEGIQEEGEPIMAEVAGDGDRAVGTPAADAAALATTRFQ